jgi:hypothetical protein
MTGAVDTVDTIENPQVTDTMMKGDGHNVSL